MKKKQTEPEPKSWAELLKQEEAKRNQPPDKSYYIRQKIQTYQEGGIFAEQSEKQNEELHETFVPVDTHIYASDTIFDPPEEEKPRKKVKTMTDHGLKLLAWGQKPFADEEKPRMMKRIKPNYQNDDFNSVTGVPKHSPFKNTVQTILKQREQSQKVMQSRTFDPVSNTFPSESLENTRMQDEEMKRIRQHEYTLSKLPENERRAHENTVNIITGEAKDEEVANKFICNFNSSVGRNKIAIQMEKDIQERREREAEKQQAKIGCRYNTPGRQRELRDWDLINGESKTVGMDASVKEKPSVWQWCQKEALP